MAKHPIMLPTVGLLGGETIQIAEGRWTTAIGDGVAFSEAGFDLIEPCLRAAYPGWTDAHRYGVFDLSESARRYLVTLLRQKAAHSAKSDDLIPNEIQLLSGFADWLDIRCDERPISVLGL